MHRAYSLLTVKAVDDEQRIITGTATTPSPDRLGDIVEPLGIKFKNPLPLLLHHRSDSPVGTVRFDKPTADGITFEARMPTISEPGKLKERIDEAWQSVKAKLIRAVSIGFRPLGSFDEAVERIKNGGLRFLKTEVLELSLVTIPANQDATIDTVRSLDSALLAATGKKANGVVLLTPPGASGLRNSKTPKEGDMNTIIEQIKDWEAKRQAKAAQLEAIMNKAAEAGRTLEAAEKEEHDTLTGEVKEIDEHLVRLGDMQKSMASRAKPVNGDSPEAAAASRDPSRPTVQVLTPKLDKGIGFARYAMCLHASGGNPVIARELAQQHYPEFAPLHNVLKLPMSKGGVALPTIRRMKDMADMLQKAAVAAGTTSDSSHHTALVNYIDLASEFAEFLRPRTIIGQFGTGSIPSMRRVPFNIRVPRQTSKASASWVGEGKPKPVTTFNTDQITLDFKKATAIIVLTDELVRFSVPSAEALVRDEIARAVAERIDIDFIDPANSGTANVKPASITNGATTAASAGDTAANVRTDIQTLFSEFIQANIPVNQGVLIMNANVALALSMMMNDLGQQEFPGVTLNGGTLVGLPVLVSQYVPEAVVVLVAASEILLADDGNVSVAVSGEASIEMLDGSLTQDATNGTGASLVSMFQTNSVAIRAEREIDWVKRRSEAVAYLTSVNWGGTAGSGDI